MRRIAIALLFITLPGCGNLMLTKYYVKDANGPKITVHRRFHKRYIHHWQLPKEILDSYR